MAPTNEAANSVRMVDRQGNLIDVPAAQAAVLFKTGQAGFARDSTVSLKTSDGAIKQVSGAEAAKTLLGGGADQFASVATQGEASKFAEQQKYGGALAQAGALGTGVANSLLLGAGDTVISKGLGLLSESAGQGYLDFARKSEEYNRGLRLAGEGAGIILPALLTGGGAGVARGAVGAATGAARGAAALGGAAERAVVSGLAKEGAASLGARALGAATGAAVEGALYGAGSAINEATLKGDELTAQKILAGAGGGALLGGVTGGLLTLGGGAIAKKLGGKADDIGAEVQAAAKAEGKPATNVQITSEAKAAAEGAKNELQTALAVRKETQVADNIAAKIERDVATKADDLTTKISSNVSASEPGTIEKFLDKFAQHKELRATGATQKMLGEVAERGEGFAAGVARQIREDLPAIAGKDSFIGLAPKQLAELAEQNLAKKGEEIGKILGKADDILKEVAAKEGQRAAFELSPYLPTVTKQAKEVLIPQIEARLGGKQAAAKVAGIVDDIERLSAGEFSFKGAQDIRRQLDKQIKWAGKAAEEDVQVALKGLRDELEKELIAGLDRVSTRGGAVQAAEYQAAKQAYGEAKWLEKATAKGADREAANRSLGLSEQLGGLGGAALSGGPLGLVTGAVGALGAGLVRRYGDQVASTLARKAIANDTLKGLITSGESRAVEALNSFLPIAQGASARGGGSKVAALTTERAYTPAPARNINQQFDSLRTQVTAYNPAQIRRSVEAVSEANPDLGAALAKQADFANNYLKSVLPPERNQNALIAPDPKLSTATPSEKQRFVDAAKVVADPNSVFDDMMNGTLNRAKVEALKTVYPNLYEDLREKTTDRLIALKERGIDVPYGKRLQLGILLDVPTDPTLTPEFIRNAQNIYAQGPTSVSVSYGQPQPGAPAKPLKMSVSYSTPVQRVEES